MIKYNILICYIIYINAAFPNKKKDDRYIEYTQTLPETKSTQLVDSITETSSGVNTNTYEFYKILLETEKRCNQPTTNQKISPVNLTIKHYEALAVKNKAPQIKPLRTDSKAELKPPLYPKKKSKTGTVCEKNDSSETSSHVDVMQQHQPFQNNIIITSFNTESKIPSQAAQINELIDNVHYYIPVNLNKSRMITNKKLHEIRRFIEQEQKPEEDSFPTSQHILTSHDLDKSNTKDAVLQYSILKKDLFDSPQEYSKENPSLSS
ncbi:hypothetical protein EDEG_02852 [Edhazardia aedis USNM 41457]|uniref:Uncharacterized protein n=1 Tax=Edhazardia aedis (strain USNM 41457) TaxID=1003232 RepID=J9D5E9_EDHAE|nr:hypothetical protein EDEG_02852 [Edhazardia aedis USNM 41457]|eukprot:EJW02759.1 hypothetical protein EDEG_02852 [Edhazardia aedis USNM 41457]